MYPAPFQYLRPADLPEALRMLEEYGDELKILAGGQSLLPMLNLRLARPGYVMDINHIADLHTIQVTDGWLSAGALVRHHTIATSTEIRRAAPLLAEAAALIGNIRVRHRGTLAGSLAHADPAAEMCACAAALRAEIVVVSPRGSRTIPIGEFLVSIMTTSLGADELITRVRIPAAGPRTGASFQELVRRAGDFAIVGVGAQVGLGEDGDTVQEIGLGLIGVNATAVCAEGAESVLRGRRPTAERLAEAAETVLESIEPEDDLHASAQYRREIAPVMVRRTLEQAIERARIAAKEGR